jgi:hypothetical protein
LKKTVTVLLSLFILSLLVWPSNPEKKLDLVTIDFKMVERGIEWLEFINSGAKDEEIKEYFMNHVAPTKGCQSIIHHWARFMEWNYETFYKFIMEALDRTPSKKKIKNIDGNLTVFGRRRQLWMEALNNRDKLKNDLNRLKSIDYNHESVQIARKYLPKQAVLKANFYFVLFGHSTAYSVGAENGYDFLQLPKNRDGTINFGELKKTFAHEMHHSGFDYLTKKYMKDIKNNENILLLGILAAEGMPTYFIDQPWKYLKEYKTHQDALYHEIASDWEKHSNRLEDLYQEAENDIRINFTGELEQKELMAKWMSGYKGAAYILGADMIRVIDINLGRKEALSVATDYRRLLLIYNRAAKKASKNGERIFIFDKKLVRKVLK